MKDYLVRSSLSYVGSIPEEYSEPSMTVPNQAMTINEILVRFRSGISIDMDNGGKYTLDSDIPDIRPMDLVERQELLEWHTERTKAQVKEFKAAKRRRTENAIKRKQAFDKWIASGSDNTTKDDTNNKGGETKPQ